MHQRGICRIARLRGTAGWSAGGPQRTTSGSVRAAVRCAFPGGAGFVSPRPHGFLSRPDRPRTPGRPSIVGRASRTAACADTDAGQRGGAHSARAGIGAGLQSSACGAAAPRGACARIGFSCSRDAPARASRCSRRGPSRPFRGKRQGSRLADTASSSGTLRAGHTITHRARRGPTVATQLEASQRMGIRHGSIRTQSSPA
jgi:hypothetical protein